MKPLFTILNLLIFSSCLIAQKPNLTRAAQTTKITVDQTQLTFNTDIINLGKAEAGYTYLGYYLSTDQVITTDDIYLGYDYVTALSFKEKSSESFSTSLANRTDIPDGTYFAGFIIDYTKRVEESNEKDNAYLWTDEKIVVNNTPNLVLVPNESTVLINGMTISYDLTVKNQGGNEAGYSYLGYYLSTDQDITTDDIYLGYDYVTALNSGEKSTESFSTNLSNRSDIPDGEYYVGAIIDYTERVAESNDNDNDRYWNNKKVTVQSMADLRLKPESISININGNIITFNCEVENPSALDASYSYLGYYLSTDATITNDDHYLGYDYVTSLTAGNYSDEMHTVNIDNSNIAPGEYFVGMIVDYTNRVAEGNENNNVYVFTQEKVTIIAEENEADCVCTNYEASSFCDDFQSYDLGAIGPQSECWTTWSGNEGNGEDGTVRSNSEGNQYMRVTRSNNIKQDGILKLGDRTSGKYELKFKMFVPDGKKGYFGIMHQYIAGGNNNDQFAQDVIFEGDGQAKIQVNNDWYDFDYPSNDWFEIKQEFDLDNNQTRLYIQGDLFAYWPFTLTNEGSNGINKLSALNFYAINGNYRFFIDDIEFTTKTSIGTSASGFAATASSLEQMTSIVAVPNQASSLKQTDVKPVKVQKSEEAKPVFRTLTNYPNPTTGLFTTSLELNIPTDISLELLDASGRVIDTQNVKNVDNLNHQFDLSNYTAGTYYVKAIVNGEVMTRPVILVK